MVIIDYDCGDDVDKETIIAISGNIVASVKLLMAAMRKIPRKMVDLRWLP